MRNWLVLTVLLSCASNAALIQYESKLDLAPVNYSYDGGWATSRYVVDSDTGQITKMHLQAFQYSDIPWFSLDIYDPISLLGGRMGSDPDGYWYPHWSFSADAFHPGSGDSFYMAWEFFAPIGNPYEHMDGGGDPGFGHYLRGDGERFYFANLATYKIPLQVPEPSALILFLVGLSGIAWRNRGFNLRLAKRAFEIRT